MKDILSNAGLFFFLLLSPQDLHRYPVKLGVISNWDNRLFRVLAVMGLEQYFDFVIPSYVVGVEKPDQRIFQLALQVRFSHATYINCKRQFKEI